MDMSTLVAGTRASMFGQFRNSFIVFFCFLQRNSYCGCIFRNTVVVKDWSCMLQLTDKAISPKYVPVSKL